MKRYAILLAGILMLSACSQGSSAALPDTSSSAISEESAAPPPAPIRAVDHGWTVGAPENHKMNPDTFAKLHEALTESSVYAMITVKDGVIIDEYYQEGYDAQSSFALHSCSKSFTSALVGIAIDQGLIAGVDEPLSQYLPQVLSLENTTKRQITLRHLLTHTTGLEWYEWGGGRSNWQEFRSAPDWVEYILGQKLVSQPGTQFNYGTGATHLLTAALEQAVGMDALSYAKANLFDPIGVESVEWGTDPQGIIDGGNGIVMTARDAARFGQLYLQGGAWHDQQIISAEWVERSTAIQNDGPGGSTGAYGFSWWVRPFGEQGYDTHYAFGAWGQYIFVVPELDLVTVIASRYPQDSYAPRPYFTDYVLPAYVG